MALTNYTELQTAIQTWVDRAGDAVFVANVADMITLAESRLNRLLAPVDTDAALVGVPNSNAIDISALSIVAPVALLASYYSNKETQLAPKTDGTFEEWSNAGKARYWSIDGTNIILDRVLDSAYSFRFRYTQRFALTGSAPTNWLLTNYPDAYLAACLAWGGAFNEDWQNGQTWKAVVDEAIPEIRNVIARNRKATLSVDPALQKIGYRWRDNSWVYETF